MGNGWRNIALEAVVCGTCMVDPWAELPRKVKLDADPGPPHYVGERVAAEVRAALSLPGRWPQRDARVTSRRRPREARVNLDDVPEMDDEVIVLALPGAAPGSVEELKRRSGWVMLPDGQQLKMAWVDEDVLLEASAASDPAGWNRSDKPSGIVMEGDGAV